MRGAAGGGAGRGAVYDGAGVGAAVRGPGPGLGVAFAALAVEPGGDAIRPPADAGQFAVAAIGAAFGAAAGLPGWAGLGRWRFACAVSGGTLIAANTISPWLIVGETAFHASCPINQAGRQAMAWTARGRTRWRCTAGR